MESLKNQYVALGTGALSVFLGFISKRGLNLPSVGASSFGQALTSFVVIGASVKAVEYVVLKEEHRQ